jgi:hypothetical protein
MSKKTLEEIVEGSRKTKKYVDTAMALMVLLLPIYFSVVEGQNYFVSLIAVAFAVLLIKPFIRWTNMSSDERLAYKLEKKFEKTNREQDLLETIAQSRK